MTTRVPSKWEPDIPEEGNVYLHADLPFDEAVAAYPEGALISLRDLAFSRIKCWFNELPQKGSFTREAIVCSPSGPTLILLESNLVRLADFAMQAHRESREFPMSFAQYHKYLELARADQDKHPLERRVLVVPKKGCLTISRAALLDLMPPTVRAQRKESIRVGRVMVGRDLLAEWVGISMPLLQDRARIQHLDPATQLGIALLRDTAMAYADYNSGDLHLETPGTEYVRRQKLPFMMPVHFSGRKDRSLIEGFIRLNRPESVHLVLKSRPWQFNKFFIVPRSAIEDVLVAQVRAERQFLPLVKKGEELVKQVVAGQVQVKVVLDYCGSISKAMSDTREHYMSTCNAAFSPNRLCKGSKGMCHLPAFGLEKTRKCRLLPWPLRTVERRNTAVVLLADEAEGAKKICSRWISNMNKSLSLMMAGAELAAARGERFHPHLAGIFARQEGDLRARSLKTTLWLVEEMGINWAEVEAAAALGNT